MPHECPYLETQKLITVSKTDSGPISPFLEVGFENLFDIHL